MTSSAHQGGISRRGFLVLGGIGVLSTQLLPTSASAATPDVGASITVAESIQARCFSADWSQLQLIDFPTTLNIAASKEPLQLDLQWDSRLFEVESRVFADTPAGLQMIESVFAGSGQLGMTLPIGTSAVYTSARAIDLYPMENVQEPSSSLVSLGASEQTRQVLLTNSASSSFPWGAEVFAEWAVSEGYSYPVVVGVRSVGPDAVPAGSIMTVRVSREVESLTVDAGEFTLSQNARPVNRSTEYVLEVSGDLPSGETQLFELASEKQDLDRVPSIAQVAYVVLTPPPSAQSASRATGKLSVASITPSGTPLSDYRRARSAGSDG